MDKCVHCGFCLPTCPSYLLLGQEMDSPRGRIYLMRAGIEGRIAIAPSVVQHFDTCLGCMACETACPSGVRYAPLIEQTRAASIASGTTSGPRANACSAVCCSCCCPIPRACALLAAAAGVCRTCCAARPGASAAAAAAADASLLELRRRQLVSRREYARAHARVRNGSTARRADDRLRAACVLSVDVNEATARVLAAEGCEVLAPADQGCCGALALHAGDDDDARAFARSLIAAFERATSTSSPSTPPAAVRR